MSVESNQRINESTKLRTGAQAKPTMSAANNIAHSERSEPTLQRANRRMNE